ncbi:hypothetical protein DJ541_23315, partial [Enterobacter asburiae]
TQPATGETYPKSDLFNKAPVWLGMSTEGYVFAALIYWIFCFSMSRYSQHLEKRFNTGRTPH